jgi:hypothetical protein
LTLGNYKGADKHLQKIQVRLIKTGKGVRLYFLYRGDTRDTAKNCSFRDGIGEIRKAIGNAFFNAHLFTIENDYQLDISNNGSSRIHIAKPAFKARPSLVHDRQKRRWVNPSAFYLKALGITSDEGKVKDRAQDKWRQINKFVEILENLIDKSLLATRSKLSIIDMGSGKGYLTFATYDYFKNVRGSEVTVTGVELRSELVDLCNDIARASEFSGLSFVRGGIADQDVGGADILIALHACDTATDEAIFKGIQANAAIIVAAPCCHQELRPQITSPAMLKDVLKHGVMRERSAEFLTDALRSLLLERSGFSTKLLDFVAVEHTPKNLMLVGTRTGKNADTSRFDRELEQIKAFYGITQQRLDTLLMGGHHSASA